MLRLLRNLHFEVHKVLRLLRICTSRFTKCCACHKICTSRFTKYCACHEICTSRFTKCCACYVNLHFEVQSATPATKSVLQGPQSIRYCSCHLPHVEKSRCTAPVTKSERVEDHHHVHSAASATKSALQSKPLRSLASVTKSRLWTTKSTRFPLHLPRKVTTMSQNAHGTTTRAQSRQAPAAPTQTLRAWASAVKMHSEDFERHECTWPHTNAQHLELNTGANP